MNAGALSSTTYAVVSPYDGISSIEGLLLEKKFAVVMEKGDYCGILVPTDIVKKAHALVIDCLTPKPQVACDDDIMQVFFTAITHNISVLPVFRDGSFHGIVTLGSIIRYQQEQHDRTQSCYEEILRSIDDALLIYDLATGAIIKSNAGAQDLLGYADQELRAMKVEDFCQSLALLPAGHGQFPAAEETVTITECEMPGKKGGIFMAETRTRQLKIDDMNVGILVFRDISERKKIDRMLRDAHDNAVRANRLKSEFLANVSHELRTPLNGILGMARLIRKETLSESASFYLEMLINASNNLLEQVNDILDFAQLEPGVLRLRNVEFDFPEFLEKNGNLFRFMAEEKGLAFKCEIDPSITYNLVGDPLRLRQVIMNFITNAVKFTEEGSVSLAVKEESRGGDRVRIRFDISDTGIGIPGDKKQIIFDRFSQANGSYAREQEGLGLGLSIAAGLVDLMGGSIHLDSDERNGTTFTIVIPFVMASPATRRTDAAPPAIEPSGTLTGRILVAEDDVINNLYVTRLLEKNGITVDSASNGHEAVRALEEKEYGLVLMDISMPMMSGIEATRIIREQHGPRIPIIALTAHAFQDDRERCIAAGMNDYLSKPINETQLMEVIRKYLHPEAGKEIGELM